MPIKTRIRLSKHIWARHTKSALPFSGLAGSVVKGKCPLKPVKFYRLLRFVRHQSRRIWSCGNHRLCQFRSNLIQIICRGHINCREKLAFNAAERLRDGISVPRGNIPAIRISHHHWTNRTLRLLSEINNSVLDDAARTTRAIWCKRNTDASLQAVDELNCSPCPTTSSASAHDVKAQLLQNPGLHITITGKTRQRRELTPR